MELIWLIGLSDLGIASGVNARNLSRAPRRRARTVANPCPEWGVGLGFQRETGVAPVDSGEVRWSVGAYLPRRAFEIKPKGIVSRG